MQQNPSIWQLSQKIGAVSGCFGCVLGFLAPIVLVGAILLFPQNFEDGEIGEMAYLVPFILGALGYVIFGVLGMLVGALVGWFKRSCHNSKLE